MKHPNRRVAPQGDKQQGVVLFIALIMLVILSLTTALAVKNATSNEVVSNNVRTTNLATQAAEIALDYCEQSIVKAVGGTPTISITTTPTIADFVDPPRWKSLGNWDTSTTPPFTIPLDSVNANGVSATFARAPECMVEKSPITAVTNPAYVVTVRGFGPEVTAVDASHTKPRGSEVWLQSTLRLK
jgi:type IV pilus assembly protein PilX